jgi:hypothetical protein
MEILANLCHTEPKKWQLINSPVQKTGVKLKFLLVQPWPYHFQLSVFIIRAADDATPVHISTTVLLAAHTATAALIPPETRRFYTLMSALGAGNSIFLTYTQ